MTVSILVFSQAGPLEEGSSLPWGASFIGALAVAFVVIAISLLRKGQPRENLSWRAAYGWAFAIFAFFTLATTWFPSWLISQQFVSSAPGWVTDIVGAGAWFVPLILGVAGLRLLQKAGRI